MIKSGTTEEILASAIIQDGSVDLKIEANNDKYSFYYSQNKDNWILLKDNVDATFLSTKTAGGFVGSLYALYATSNGRETNNTALFDWFEYKGNDDVFK